MAQKVTGSLIKDVFLDILREILYFPIWWYSAGLIRAAKFFWQRVKNMEVRLGVGVWVKNILKPMFGQRDIAGVLISLFMRIIQIIVRTLVLFFWSVLVLLGFFIWIALPIFVVFGIVLNLAAG